MKCAMGLIDLDENVFRIIFEFLDVPFIYSMLRLTCRKLNDYVKNYIKIVPQLFLHPIVYPVGIPIKQLVSV